MPELQKWAGKALRDLQWRHRFGDLADIRDSVIILDVTTANHQIEITQQLAQQNNHLVFNYWAESGNLDFLPDLLVDLGDFDDYSVLSSADYLGSQPWINLDLHLHQAFADSNRLECEGMIDRVFDGCVKPWAFDFVNLKARRPRRQLWQRLAQLDLIHNNLCAWTHRCGLAPDFDPDQESEIPLTLLPENLNSVFSNNLHSAAAAFESPWHTHDPGSVISYLVPERLTRTYFSVCVQQDVEGTMIGESVYNCLLTGHPFVALAAPGMYDRLHRMGFQTFHPYINESFDSESDLDRRQDLVVAEIQRLCASDLDRFLREVEPICRHNRQHYLLNRWHWWTRTHQELDDFFRRLLARGQN